MTPEEAVRALDAINTEPEEAHAKADEVLLAAVPAEVADAYRRVIERVGEFWYA